ncbi:MAG: hypothetical protein F4W99_08990 [Chloroflexi bacterium]|nr:hypothetical protein [Chloroflexota bacterium]
MPTRRSPAPAARASTPPPAVAPPRPAPASNHLPLPPRSGGRCPVGTEGGTAHDPHLAVA